MVNLIVPIAKETSAIAATNPCHTARLSMKAHADTILATVEAGKRESTLESTEIKQSSTQ